MKKLILLFLILTHITSICMKGCLKCDIDGTTCLFCDNKNLYYLYDNDTCIRNEIDDCVKIDLSGSCLQCKSTHYLKSSTKCSIIDESSLIPNCLEYNSSKLCSMCSAGYYPLLNTCILVTPAIEGCSFYNFDKKCRSCNDGYILNSNGECIKVQKVKFFLYYS